MVICKVLSEVSMCQHHNVPILKTGYIQRTKDQRKVHQATAKPSQDMKKEAAKLNRVQDHESSIMEVKKSLRYL